MTLSDLIERLEELRNELGDKDEAMTKTNDLIYDVEDGSMVAVITFETPSSRGTGSPQWATVKASLRVDAADDDRTEAYYLSHEGDATEDDIAYAIRCIETNSFAT